ncbi:MSC_0622 family F1-like ATPase gamma subunit [Mycoplasma hafezii]|uniref:MSC_0622 family F1-like ATPase gamma subunit n=1 Tax=Mycoplasma hafezii TaxID=525886 RepID=UPI003CF3ED08
MHIRKIKSKYESFEKIIKIVESNKNITLINILKLSKQISFYYERAVFSKDIILTLAKEKNLDSQFLKPSQINLFETKQNKNKPNRTIWVYVTEEEQYSTNSYAKFENNLLQEYKKQDVIIAIGKRAIDFAVANQFKILFCTENNDVEYLSSLLPLIIQKDINQNGFANLYYIINSSKVKNMYLNVLPLEKLNFNLNVQHYKLEEQINIKKLNVFPDLNSFVESEINTYLTYMTYTLLSESALIYHKYKLVAQNQQINDLEKKQKQLKLQMLRSKREDEVEQMQLLSKKKDLLHSE